MFWERCDKGGSSCWDENELEKSHDEVNAPGFYVNFNSFIFKNTNALVNIQTKA